MKRYWLRFKKYFTNREVYIPLIVFLLLLTATTFYYGNIKLPKELRDQEERLRQEIDVNAMPVVLTAIVKDPKGIPKYTKLTEKLIEERIEWVEVPEKFALQRGARSNIDLIGKVAMEDLRQNEQVNKSSLSDEEVWFGRYERIKEYIVKTIVAEEVEEGNLVDLIVNYGDGDYDVVLSKVKVKKLLKGNVMGSDTETRESSLYRDNEYMVTFGVDEIDYRDLIAAEKLANLIAEKHETEGYFELRLYIDNDQPPSMKTFNYETKYKKMIGLLDEKETTNKKILEYIEEDRRLQEQIKANPTEDLINEYYYNKIKKSENESSHNNEEESANTGISIND